MIKWLALVNIILTFTYAWYCKRERDKYYAAFVTITSMHFKPKDEEEKQKIINELEEMMNDTIRNKKPDDFK